MYTIIINPKAGKGKSLKALRLLEEKFHKENVPFEVLETERQGHAAELARGACLAGATDLIALGGDGTLSEVLNGIPDPSAVRLGLVPCGTGNDFAASARIPTKPSEAIELILHGAARPTDYMELPGGIRGINVIGTGIDVDVLKRCRRSKVLRGKIRYAVSLLISTVRFRFYSFRLRADGGESEHRALVACVGNGRMLGGGIPICPEASIDDGLLDCVIVGKVRKIAIPAAFVTLMRGKILKKKYAFFERTAAAEIAADEPMTVQVDGELYDGVPFRVSVVPGGMNFYHP